ncbi:M91 family zinc metallopeptidase [Zunongwangia pacifica]
MYQEIAGDSLWIEHKGNKILYEDGNLMNADGTAYTGKGVKVKKDGSIKLKGFLKKATNALNTLSSKDAGNSIVDELQSSTDNYSIVSSSSGNSYDPNTNTISFDTSSKNGGLNQDGNTRRPTFVGLGHELAHGVDDDRGTLNMRVDASFGFRNAEKFSTHMENQIRAEHGISLRTHYGQDANGNWQGSLLLGNGRTPESRYYPGYHYGGINSRITLPSAGPVLIINPIVIPTINKLP